MKPLTVADKERLLDALEMSMQALGWIGHADEYWQIHEIIESAPAVDNDNPKEG